MKKKCILLFSIFFIFSSFLTFLFVKTNSPVFAESGGELLSKYGFVKGGSNGDLMLDQKLTREQLAVLVCELHGKSIEASRFKRPPNYIDAYKFPAWSKNYISYAQYMGWMVGVGEKRFNNTGYVSDLELATAMTKVLGYTAKDYRDALNIMDSIGVKIPQSKSLTRGEAFDVIWTVVSNPLMKNGKTLGEVTGRLHSDTSRFRVKDIRSNNYGFVVVEFNKPVDAISVNRNSIRLVNVVSGKEIEIYSVRVSGNQVFFIPTEKFTRGSADCTISGINSGWGENDKMETVERRILFEDNTPPNFIGFEFSGEREITLIFDEPISSVGTVRLKFENINIGVSETGVKGLRTDRLTFQVFANFQEGKTYEVKPQYFTDLVGKNNIVTSQKAVYTKRTSNPVLQIGEQTAEYVELIFSAPVKGVEESRFYHTSQEKKPIKITASPNFNSVPISKNDYIDRAYLWFYDSSSDQNHPLPSGETVLYVDERGISDGFNEELKAGTYAVRAENGDKNRVEYVRFEAPKKLKIGLSMKSGRPHVVVKDDEGEELKLEDSVLVQSKEYVFTLEEEVDSEVISVQIESKDRSLVPHHVQIRIGDREPPKVVKAMKKTSDDGYYLMIEFTEAVDDSALLLSNYQMVSGSSVRSITGQVKLHDGGRVVRIDIPKNDYQEIVDKAGEMYISGIKDLAGNIMASVKVKVEEQ
ncbi:MAG: Ig-like domain-containing protein [Bacillota bacterium]|nr:Ig-like domain-containing protein [Bacillota bacterium]